MSGRLGGWSGALLAGAAVLLALAPAGRVAAAPPPDDGSRPGDPAL